MDYEQICKELNVDLKEDVENRRIQEIKKGKRFKKRGKGKVKVVRIE